MNLDILNNGTKWFISIANKFLIVNKIKMLAQSKIFALHMELLDQQIDHLVKANIYKN